MKKIGLFFATVVMIMLFAFSASALDSTGQCGDNVCWDFDSTTGELVISGKGDMWDYVSGESPFYNCEDIIRLAIRNGVTSVGDFSFELCFGITDIDFGDSVEEIGDSAFVSCINLNEVIIPDSVIRVGYLSFLSCVKVTDIVLGDNAAVIDEGAFELCSNLRNINIPDSVTTIGKDAFYECTSLHSIILGSGVSVIGDSSFYGSGIRKIEIPASVKTIDDYAFEYCENLEEVIIGDIDTEVAECETTIGRRAFNECEKLGTLIVGNNVCSIGSEAFFDCVNLKNVKLSDNVSYIGEYVFYNCGFTNIVLPAGLTTIESHTLASCRCLERIYIPVGVITIEPSVVNKLALSDIYYEGTEEQWNSIDLDYDSNYVFSYVNIHFNHKHKYTVSDIITPSSHLLEGTGIYTCECGDNYVDSVPKSKDHNYMSEITTPATHLTEGETTYTCECGGTYTEVIEKLEGHTYKENVAVPTCTEKGYTTYTCSCGDTYTADEIPALGHTDSEWIIDTDSTCSAEGSKHIECTVCGEPLKTESIARLPHDYISVVTAPTCEKDGYTTYICDCGENYVDDISAATGHSYNGNGTCTVCGENKTDNCTCNCHKGGFSGFIWKILSFLYKLFKINPVCKCGTAHY